MPSEKQAFEGAAVPVHRFAIAAAATFAGLLLSLAAVFGFYRAWVNGPQTPLKPAPLSNRSAPALETELFRQGPAGANPDAKVATDAAPQRVETPIERAMAAVVARGSQAFDPVPGSPPAGGDAR